MKLGLAAGTLQDVSSPALVVMMAQGAPALSGHALAADQATGGLVATLLAQGDFKGKAGEAMVLYTPDSGFKRLVLVGLGRQGKLTLEHVRNAAGKAALTARGLGVKSLTVAVPEASSLGWAAGLATPDALAVTQAAAEGAALAQYQLHLYRTKDLDDVQKLDAIDLLPPAGLDAAAGEAVLTTTRVLAETTSAIRTLILHPGNVLTPERFAAEAVGLGGDAGLTVSVMEPDELEKRGFRTLLIVGRGSVHSPRLIRLEWPGGAAGEAPLVIVGKGITFDTGGIGIKPGPGMEKMKYDMAGGGATLGILLAAARLGLKRNIVGLIPAAENMPGADAVKPGDIVTAYDGQTIEINDTDAEGRLVLADALAYAVDQENPAALIDMATLTGAVGVALGRDVMGVMGNHQGLVDQVIAAGELAGERGWQLPMFEEYEEQLDSDIADMKNYGGRYGGTIGGAKFLERFVKDVPWVHLDIAGVAWTDKEKGYRPAGPTGSPLRMILNVIRNWQPV